MSVFVGLDLSLRSTGFCAMREDGTILAADAFGGELKRTATVPMKLNRIISIASRILADIEKFRNGSVAHVAIENYAYGARGSQNDLAELHGVVKVSLFAQRNIVPLLPSPAQCRKVVFGSGKTKKADAHSKAKAVLTEAGFKCETDDVADAYAVAEWLRRTKTKV